MIFKKSKIASFALMLMVLSPLILAFINSSIIIFTDSGFSFSTPSRILIFLILCYTFLLTKLDKFKSIFFLSLIYWTICFVVWAFATENFSITREIEQLLKIITPVFLIYFYVYILRKSKQTDLNLMSWVSTFGLVGGLMIIFSLVTGINVEESRYYEFGISSFFIAKNEISLSLLLTTPITLFLFVQYKKMKYLAILLITMSGMFLLGNKSAFLGSFIVIIFYAIAFVYFPKREIKWSLENRLFVFLLLFSGSVLFAFGVFYIVIEYPHMVKDFIALLEKNPREVLVNIASERISSRPLILNIFGEGAFSFGIYVEEHHPIEYVTGVGKLAEQDVYDVLGMFGYVLGLFWLAIPVYFLYNALKKFILNKSVYFFTLFIGLALFVGHSFTAGHAMMSPMVGSIIGIYYYFIYVKSK